jgi:non-specific serine/threonine protein kinase
VILALPIASPAAETLPELGASHAESGGQVLELAATPSGRLYLETRPASADCPPAAAAARIVAAFEAGAGAGLLRLGAAELTTPLTPSLAFARSLGHLFMTRLCAVPDLAARWPAVELPPPVAELERLAEARPPATGGEFLDAGRLAGLWHELLAAARAAIDAAGGEPARWLAAQHPSWNMVGRICFHLAEHKASEATPFAFLATYAARVSAQAKVQHLPLGRALTEHAGNRAALLALLTPVGKAAEHCPWV